MKLAIGLLLFSFVALTFECETHADCILLCVHYFGPECIDGTCHCYHALDYLHLPYSVGRRQTCAEHGACTCADETPGHCDHAGLCHCHH